MPIANPSIIILVMNNDRINISGIESKPTYAEAVVGATTSEPAVPIVAG